MPLDEALLARVRGLLGDGVIEKRMVGGRSFMIGGHLLCGIRGDHLMVRLGADGVRAALTEPHVKPMQMGDKTVTGFVLVSRHGIGNEAQLTRWLERARTYVASLPP